MMEHSVLLKSLLVQLAEREAHLQEGDSVLVQPYIEGMNVENPLIVPGYDHDQIDEHLKLLVRRAWIETGGVKGGALIGLYFSGLTPAGRRAMLS